MDSGQDAGAAAAVAQTAGDDEPAAGAEAGQPAAAPVWTAVMAVLLAVLIAGAVTAGVFLAQVRASDAASSRRQAVVTAARAAVTDLTTADYRHPQRYVSRLRAIGTGTFLSLFTNSATGFTHVLIQGKVETAGRVAVVGVQRLGTDTAQLSVLAYVRVRNAQSPGGAQRTYRMTVWLISAGSRWLVSNVEFVK